MQEMALQEMENAENGTHSSLDTIIIWIIIANNS